MCWAESRIIKWLPLKGEVQRFSGTLSILHKALNDSSQYEEEPCNIRKKAKSNSCIILRVCNKISPKLGRELLCPRAVIQSFEPIFSFLHCPVLFSTVLHYSALCPEAAFFGEIQTKVLRVFLFALSFLFHQIHATFYCFYIQFSYVLYTVKEKGGNLLEKPYYLFLCFKKSIQKPQVWELSRLCPENSTKLYVHEFGLTTVQHCLAGLKLTIAGVCRDIPADYYLYGVVCMRILG